MAWSSYPSRLGYARVAEACLPGHSFDALTFPIVVRGDVIEAFAAGTVCLIYRLPTAAAGSVALRLANRYQRLGAAAVSPVRDLRDHRSWLSSW